MRRQLLETPTALVAGQVLAVTHRVPLGLRNPFPLASDHEYTLAKCHSILDRLGNTRSRSSLDDYAIDHDLHAMLPAAVDLRCFSHAENLAVHADPLVSTRLNIFPQRLVVLPNDHFNRCQQVETRS